MTGFGCGRGRGDWLGLWPLVIPVLGFYLPIGGWLCLEPPAAPTVGLSADSVVRVLVDTFAVATIAALGAGLLGTLEAVSLWAFPVRGRHFVEPFLLLPFLFPPAVLTTAANALLAGGPCGFLVRGVWGAALLSAWQMAPIVFWGVSSAIRGVDRAEREALTASFPPLAGTLRVLVPRVRGTIARMTLLVFALLVPAREVAGYAGVETLGDRVLAAFTASRDPSEGWALTGLLAAMTLPIAWAVVRGERRAQALPAVGGRAYLPAGPAARWVTGGLWTVALSWTIPWGALLHRAAGHPVPTLGLWTEGLALEAVRAAALAFVIVGLGWRLALTQRRGVVLACALPLLVPGSLGALALLETVQHWLPRSWTGPVLLNLGQAARYLGVGVVLGLWAIHAVPQSQRNAAELLLGPRTRRWCVLTPLAAPFLTIAGLVVMVLILGDVEVASLLMPPGQLSPIVELHQFLHFRHDAQAAQLAVGLGAVGVLVAVLLGWLTPRGRSSS
ncbi:MAG: hypothetical protein AB7O52_12045 [Planctomycetota bacterium]